MVVSRASVCTHSAMGEQLKGPTSLVGPKHTATHTATIGANYRLTGSCRGPGYRHALLWGGGYFLLLHSHSGGCTGAEACPECLPGGLR